MLGYPTFDLRNILATLLIGALLFLPMLAYFDAPSQLEQIQHRGELVVATRQSPTTYFEQDGELAGFEYELAKAYADYLGVQLKILSYDNLAAIGEALRLNNAHLAAAGLNRTQEREQQFRFGPDYLHSRTLLIYRQGTPKPDSLTDLQGELQVVASSSHAELLSKLELPAGSWQTASTGVETIDLLDAVDRVELTYTLVDDLAFNIYRSYHPRLRSAFELGEPQPISWMMKPFHDNSLTHSLKQFFELPETQTLLNSLRERYLESDHRLDLVDNLTFRKHVDERLPLLREWFEQAAEEIDQPWTLLAAIGYQESHWNPKAVSPTGVRGIMMLTQATARSLGIKKRTDPEQSIRGGARYFATMRRRLPERIQEPDKTLFALAAYNVGRGHLEDARVLTQRAGKDPDSWNDVREFLPLLADPRWYKQLKHGFARGQEPVIYVSNIQRYRQELELESRREAIQSASESTEPTASDAAPALPLPETL